MPISDKALVWSARVKSGMLGVCGGFSVVTLVVLAVWKGVTWQEVLVPAGFFAFPYSWLRLFGVEVYQDAIRYRSMATVFQDTIRSRSWASGWREMRFADIDHSNLETNVRGQPFVCLAIRPRAGTRAQPLLVNFKVLDRDDALRLLNLPELRLKD